ncbi:MAG TPA: hypothetical protein VMW12_01940 [Candidatus Dormibacteraeota bacterium]|nr:hypothetical protein [Candidatus Dormibacteraeota bacterium]
MLLLPDGRAATYLTAAGERPAAGGRYVYRGNRLDVDTPYNGDFKLTIRWVSPNRMKTTDQQGTTVYCNRRERVPATLYVPVT